MILQVLRVCDNRTRRRHDDDTLGNLLEIVAEVHRALHSDYALLSRFNAEMPEQRLVYSERQAARARKVLASIGD